MKWLSVLCIRVCMFCFMFIASAGAQNRLDLDALITAALDNNPEISVSERKKEALWERPSQARAWDDPKLTFGVANLPADDFDFNKQDMTQKTVSISQQIPFPGIPSLREKVAVEEAKRAEKELENTRTGIVKAVKKTYYELYFINESLNIIGKNEDILKKFVELTRIKYEVGQGLQEDVLKAEVELYKLQENLIGLRQQKITLQADLNRLLGREASFALEGEPVLEITGFDFTPRELEETAQANNPVLLSLRHLIERSEAEHKLAGKQYFPRFTLTASYGQRDNRRNAQPFPAEVTGVDTQGNQDTNRVFVAPLGDDRDRPDFFSLFVGVTIPLWFKSKQSKKVSETNLKIAQAKLQYESAKNNIFFRLHDIGARIKKNKKLINLYRDNIIPQATQSLDADMAAYQVGKIDFLTLLSSRITLFNYEIQYRRVMSNYEMELAELEAVVGKRLF